MNRTLHRIVGVAACLVALSAPAVPAHAETQSHRDPKGDVAALEPLRRAGSGIDVVGSVNTFERRTLRMTLKAVKLAKQGYVAQWFIRTAQTSYVLVYNRTTPEPTVQFGEFGGPPRIGRSSAGIPPVCDGVTVKARAPKARVSAVVPRSCIAGASSVRIAAVLVKPTAQGINVDDARRKGFPADAGFPKFGPSLDRN